MLNYRNPVRQIEFMREVVSRLREGLKTYVETGEDVFPIHVSSYFYWRQKVNVHEVDYDELLADVVRTFDKSLAEIDQMRNCIENLRLRG